MKKTLICLLIILAFPTIALAINFQAGEDLFVSNPINDDLYAAGVTIQKLLQTGTAKGDEILEVASDPDYIFQPELAQDIRLATYYKDSE